MYRNVFPARKSLVSENPGWDGKIANLFYSVAPYQYYVRIVSLLYLALVELLLASQESLSLHTGEKGLYRALSKKRGSRGCLYLCQVTVSLAEVVRVEPRDS